MTDTETPTWESRRSSDEWAVVEIMGHRVVAGSVSEATYLGVAMLQVQHPSLGDHSGTGPLTEMFAATAIFSIRPCSREEATRWAESRWRRSVDPEPSYAELVDYIDDEVDEVDEWLVDEEGAVT